MHDYDIDNPDASGKRPPEPPLTEEEWNARATWWKVTDLDRRLRALEEPQ